MIKELVQEGKRLQALAHALSNAGVSRWVTLTVNLGISDWHIQAVTELGNGISLIEGNLHIGRGPESVPFAMLSPHYEALMAAGRIRESGAPNWAIVAQAA